MNRNDAAREVKRRYAEYLKPAKKKIGGKPTYICPLCGNGTGDDGDGMVIDPNGDGTQLKCFKCGFYGDIVDLYQQEHNCTKGEAFAALYDYFGITIDGAESRTEPRQLAQGINVSPTTENPPESRTEAAESTADYTAYYDICKSYINSDAARQYLNLRGISEETAAAFWLGYDPEADPANAPGAMGNQYKPHPAPRIIIPFDKSHYMGRRIDGKQEYKKMNSKGAGLPPFNFKALYNASEWPIFITEGVFDALSVIEVGRTAIALNGTNGRQKLIEALKKKRPRSVLIIALDNDPSKIDANGKEIGKAGQKAAAALAKELRELGVPFLQANISGQYKDANEALVNNRVAFIEAVKAAELEAMELYQSFQPIQAVCASDYMSRGVYEKDIAYFRQYKDRKTGMHPDIDRHLTLYPGLAALGGASSLGKTTFAVNLIDHLLENGETVLYFSLEQLPIEIITKSLARRMASLDPFTRLTNTEIKNGATSPELEAIKKEYAQQSQNYRIITGSFRTTAADIVAYVERYRRENGGDSCKPIVIIDYLQLIAPPSGFKGGIREYTDENIKALKDMQKRNGLFVLMISNFNRSSNYEPVSYESFKETSMIEYTCDFIWGLQLAILDAENSDFYTITGPKGGRTERPIDQKRKLINEAQDATPKKVEFVSLKNRNGKQFFKAFFDYYPKYDCYIAIEQDDTAANKGGKRPF